MKNNITDIASIAGVSPATVSNALNDRKGVSEETKQKILAIAKELGYYKEANASIDPKNIRFVIYKKHGMVVADTPFFSSLVEGIENECRTQGYELLISHVYHSECEKLVNILNTEYSQGLIILATEMYPEDLKPFRTLDIPIVLLDSQFKGENFDCIVINNMDAAYKATKYLIQNGHRKLGYLHSSVHINNFHYRKLGFLDALQEAKLEFNAEFDFLLEPTMEGAYRDMKMILAAMDTELPTALFADNDIIAFGAMRALTEKGISIPRDISIVGFDDMPFCEITSPRLTTVKVFKQEIGSVAVRRLLQKIESGKADIMQTIEVNTELIIRDSVLNVVEI
jgi:DNA-binding LacI/PurR family transcriptional regulator